MLPLRFPNSGIRAKVFMRKISFKLRVMRLNRVESFYAFLLRFAVKTAKRRGSRAWPGHLQVGGRLQPRPPCKGWPPAGVVAARGYDRLPRRNGLPTVRLHGGGRQRPARGQPCRLHRGSGSAEGGKERDRASF
ncbi:hypothetical protein BHE74_00057211 [Ensete ventricosum]|nr:hypothetical protein BHE74_00057211 [Ensete ventricosum]